MNHKRQKVGFGDLGGGCGLASRSSMRAAMSAFARCATADTRVLRRIGVAPAVGSRRSDPSCSLVRKSRLSLLLLKGVAQFAHHAFDQQGRSRSAAERVRSGSNSGDLSAPPRLTERGVTTINTANRFDSLQLGIRVTSGPDFGLWRQRWTSRSAGSTCVLIRRQRWRTERGVLPARLRAAGSVYHVGVLLFF